MTKCIASFVFSVLLITALAAQETLPEASDDETPLTAWSKIYEVFSHPRCANCHVPEDGRPRWSGPSYGLDDGEWTYHAMNVHGGQSRIGITTLPCTTCHTAENSETPHGPPGAPVWALPPAEMAWWEKSANEICEQIKDPARNGNRTLADIADHIAHDELVHWGWSPGPGREPAPYSAETVANFVNVWASGGAPCPAP
ncbi:MAG: hypothetical protein AAGD92_04225 [Pseudomonadota bacterium]